MQGVLSSIERVGNKLPHPFILFTILAAIVVVISTILATLGVSAINPQTDAEVYVRSLLSSDGIEFMLTSVVSNFVNFPPLGLILVVMFGIGLAEKGRPDVNVDAGQCGESAALSAYLLCIYGRYLRQHRIRRQLSNLNSLSGYGVLLGWATSDCRCSSCLRCRWSGV